LAVYDSFLFFNELDLLEIRLNLMNDCVDHFVISESNLTFSGNKKPLYYQENKERFAKFKHKIIHQIIEDNPTNFENLNKFENSKNTDQENLNKIFSFIDRATNFPKKELHWGRDFFQRECLHRALAVCKDEDVVIFSDIDEIPNPKAVREVLELMPSPFIYTLLQKEFNYYLNMYKQEGWMGPRIANYGVLKNCSFNEIRAIIGPGKTMVDTVAVNSGGWHFTSLGGEANVIHKIESWGHQELNTTNIKKNVRRNLESGRDIFQRPDSKRLQKVKIDENTFPKWLVDNQESYSHLISNDSGKKKSFIRNLISQIISG
jgi:beta-1,4-mannosyl-glycoprotein beta-1,4-N-acetylglucosaminyltransferase